MHEAWLPREHPLHRPRHGRRQIPALICAVAFFLTPTLGWIFGARAVEFENRRLAEFPSITQGWEFFSGLSQWATDHLVFRDEAVRAADTISRGVFGEPAPFGQKRSDTGPVAPPPPADPQIDQGDNGETDSSAFRSVIEGKDGWLYFGDDIRNKCDPIRDLEKTLERLERFRAAVEQSGRKFVLVIPPDKTTMVREYLPSRFAGRDCAERATEDFWRLVGELPKAIDLREDLKRHADRLRRPIYYKLDSHWTDDGALVMVRRVAEKLQPGVSDGWKISDAGTHSFRADLPTLQGRQVDDTGPLYDVSPDGSRKTTRNVPVEFGQLQHMTIEPVDGMITDRTLLLGDSFTITASRYMSAVFSDLTVLSYAAGYSDPDAVANALLDREVVVLEVVERVLARGDLPILSEPFLDRVEALLAANPVR
ncbi:MAG TPA: hypothetical protein VIL00_07485 [Pseudonocardiaceae bacterium]